MKKETYLPIFQGFYGTLFESDHLEEQAIENLNEDRAENKLKPVEWDDVEFDYQDYMHHASLECCGAIERQLQYIDKSIVIEFQKIVSPREYNFTNDSIDIEVTIDNYNIILKYVEDNKEAFNAYIKECYTSYDGFTSFVTNNPVEWLNEFKTGVKEEHKLGSLLNFILINEEYDSSQLYDDCNDLYIGITKVKV